MHATPFINFLIEYNNCDSFLEIRRIGSISYIKAISCKLKKGIFFNEHQLNAVLNNSSQNVKDRYKFILLHRFEKEEFVRESLKFALNSLLPNGLIAIPVGLALGKQLDKKGKDRTEQLDIVFWKTILDFFCSSSFSCQIIDLPETFVLIDTSQIQKSQQYSLPFQLGLNRCLSLLESYRVNIDYFLQRKVEVFYHLACMGNWAEVFDEQMFQLGCSGYCKINMCMLGTKSDRSYAMSIAKKHNIEVSIVFFDSNITHFEIQAMLAVEKYAQSNRGFVLYLHSKGVSKPHNLVKIKWRHLMMEELVLKWRNCIRNILTYDLIGVNWIDMHPLSHFSGNFWYASTKYLKTLTDFNKYYYNPNIYHTDIVGKRIRCETWIGSYSRKPKILSLRYRNITGNKWKRTLTSEIRTTTIKR